MMILNLGMLISLSWKDKFCKITRVLDKLELIRYYLIKSLESSQERKILLIMDSQTCFQWVLQLQNKMQAL
jgi:hypothetical protein